MRKLLITATLLLSFVTLVGAQTVPDSTEVTPAALADQIIEYGESYIGTPYRRGGKGPKVFDCSGFTSFVYKHFGYKISSNSAMQGKDGRSVEGDLSALQKGDLVLFSGSRNSSSIGHVGIFIGMDPSGDSFSFIHASTSDGVRISHYDEAYYKKRFRCARRIIPDIIPEPQIDTVVVFDEKENAFIEPVFINLSSDDQRIVIFNDGTWKTVDEHGQLHSPEEKKTITLLPDGSWKEVKSSNVMIPTMAKPKTEPSQANGSAVVADDTSEEEYYTIKSGDTLGKIAARNHTTVKALCNLNGITETTTLRIGRKLRIK